MVAALVAPHFARQAALGQGASYPLPVVGVAAPGAFAVCPLRRAFRAGPAASSASSVLPVAVARLRTRLRSRAGGCPLLDDAAAEAPRALRPQCAGM